MADGLTLLLSGSAIATERLARAQAADTAERLGDRERARSILEGLEFGNEADGMEAEAAMQNLAELVIFAHQWIQARRDAAT